MQRIIWASEENSMPTIGEIYYFDSKNDGGTRPPVVLLHAAGGNHLNWPHQIRRLPGYRVLAPDLPGHGKSTGLGAHIIKDYADIIVKWLLEIGIYQAIFIGHSMGGAIAQTIAFDYPERIAALGLIATAPKFAISASILEKLGSVKTFENAAGWIVEQSYFGELDKKEKLKFTEKLLETRYPVVHGDYLASDKFDSREELKNINVPTHIICGEKDKITPLRYSEYLCAHIKRSNLSIIPEAGHMVMLEQPEKTEKILTDFLDGIKYQ
jgi:pimeloyl-ACP methyl ester carboxylesterase